MQIRDDSGHLDAVRDQPDLSRGKTALHLQTPTLGPGARLFDLFANQLAKGEIRKTRIEDPASSPVRSSKSLTSSTSDRAFFQKLFESSGIFSTFPGSCEQRSITSASREIAFAGFREAGRAPDPQTITMTEQRRDDMTVEFLENRSIQKESRRADEQRIERFQEMLGRSTDLLFRDRQ